MWKVIAGKMHKISMMIMLLLFYCNSSTIRLNKFYECKYKLSECFHGWLCAVCCAWVQFVHLTMHCFQQIHINVVVVPRFPFTSICLIDIHMFKTSSIEVLYNRYFRLIIYKIDLFQMSIYLSINCWEISNAECIK